MSPFSHLHEVQSSGHLELGEDFLDIGEIGLSTVRCRSRMSRAHVKNGIGRL